MFAEPSPGSVVDLQQLFFGELIEEGQDVGLDHLAVGVGVALDDDLAQVVDRAGTDASYSQTHEGHTMLPDGRHLVTDKTLRFRSWDEIVDSLERAGLELVESWGDWDRTPRTPTCPELIVLAQAR